ncbi:alpha/beta fold hydrolase [Aquimarina addita]|uniref:Alpha/beta fold hydrolase n=1 Tax=Aquimarina addita TaxID=870485 RepID=A0ABP6URL1_9FLAO
MIISHKNILVSGKHQKSIVTDVFYTNEIVQKPVVIFCHGYKGFKDWGAWDLVANAFAKAGFFFVKFNFSYNGGTVEQPIDFSDLDAFGHNNYIKELDDVESVLDWITTTHTEYTDFIDTTKITLIGHSRGGGIVLIKAAEDARVQKLITWASVSDYKNRFPKGADFEKWENSGVYYVKNGRTKQEMPHYFQFYTSFIENKERLTISRAAKKIKIPHLIIHGSEDPTVSIEEAQKLHAWNRNSHMLIVKEADHVFGTKHPWSQQYLPNALQKIITESVSFAIF